MKSLIIFVFIKKFCVFTGIPIRSTLDNSTTVQYAGLISQLAAKARSTVRDIDPGNDLTFLRIRSKKHEIMVAPGMYTDYIYVCYFVAALVLNLVLNCGLWLLWALAWFVDRYWVDKRVSKNWQLLPFRKSFRNTEILLNTETFLKKYIERTRGNYWKSKSEFYYKQRSIIISLKFTWLKFTIDLFEFICFSILHVEVHVYFMIDQIMYYV